MSQPVNDMRDLRDEAAASGQDRVAAAARLVRPEAVRRIGDGAARALVLAPLPRSRSARKALVGAAVAALPIGLPSRR